MPDSTAYAIVETGGKQYRVSTGQTIEVELLPAKEGTLVELDRVLMLMDSGRTLVGTPHVTGAKVLAQSLGESKGEKIIVLKYRNKVRYRHKTGHRQHHTKLQITDIVGPAAKPRARSRAKVSSHGA